MQAETVYNVYRALPDEEKARLRIMLDNDTKAVATVKKADDKHFSITECADALLKILKKQKDERFNKTKMKVV